MVVPENRLAILRKMYSEGKNLMEYLRAGQDRGRNSQQSIEVAYDLQSGSYTDAIKDSTELKENREVYANLIGEALKSLNSTSLLDAGTGEATSLAYLLTELGSPADVYGFDISLSRLLFAKKFLAHHGHNDVQLLVGCLDNIPFADASVDTVITNHALEPNGGREQELVAELLRIAGRYIVLVEPSWELGDKATRARIEHHGYVKGLADTFRSLGATVLRHELWPEKYNDNPVNQAALIIVQKTGYDTWTPPKQILRSPMAFGELEDRGAYLYSQSDGFLFPVIEGVPCLLREHGILASRLKDALKPLEMELG